MPMRLAPTLLAAVVAVTAAGGAVADVTVGRNVPAAQRVSFDQVDHSAWDALLRKYVDRAGMVDYRAWKASTADRTALGAYLQRLSAADPGRPSSREAKLAFWINAYNAVTVEGILREYPTSSIRNHTAKLFGYNIWHDLLLLVGGKPYSLDEMEHQVLRKLGEPRIHFAIVCASIGCPRLLNEAYTASRLERQLETNARAFFADRSKFRYDAGARKLWLSPILDWFGEDFGPTPSARLKRIARWLPEQASRQLAASGNATVAYLDYDWSINDQSR